MIKLYVNIYDENDHHFDDDGDDDGDDDWLMIF